MTESDKILSFIVPVYNVEPFLAECLNSLLQQDVPPETYEVICVDDGSTDGSGTILDDYAEKHANLTVIHQQNGGVSAARNQGIERATGKYVWFVDSDDFIAANCLGIILQTLAESDCDQLTVLPASFTDQNKLNCFSQIPVSQYSKKISVYLITRILRKKAIDDIKLRFNPQISYQEDNVFYTILYPHIKKKLILENQICYFYRERPGSLSRGGIQTQRVITSYIFGSVDMKRLYETDGNNYNGYAFNLYMFVNYSVLLIIDLPSNERQKYLKELREKGLFPLKYKKEYTTVSIKSGDSWKQKIKKNIFSISYTRFGYSLLYAMKRLRILS